MVGDASREDAAADARPRRVQPGARAALVDDHGVALDSAVRIVVADVYRSYWWESGALKSWHMKPDPGAGHTSRDGRYYTGYDR